MYDVFVPLVCVSFTQFPFPGQLLGAIYTKTIQKLSQPITHEVSNKSCKQWHQQQIQQYPHDSNSTKH